MAGRNPIPMLVVAQLLLIGLLSYAFFLPDQDSAARGKELYQRYCGTCHGVDGKGEGSAAIYLSPKPRDFTKAAFKFQSTPVGSLPTDDDLHRTIKNGMPGSAMPAWDRLAEQERRDLVTYLKNFSERFSSEKPTDVLPVSGAPPSTPAMIKNGRTVYALAGCWMCHGKTGAGGGPSSPFLADEIGRPIPPYNFTRAGAFKGGGTPQDIYRTFSTGIGGTPMPGYSEDALVFGRESAADLTSLEGHYTQAEIEEVRTVALQWPTEQDIALKTPEQRKAMGDERRWSLVYYVLSLSQSGKSTISYTTTDHPLVTTSVASVDSFTDPRDQEWRQVKPTELALISLWQRDTPIDRVTVRVVADEKAIAFLLEWDDPTQDDRTQSEGGGGDAAAIQFPLDPASHPFFGMGDTSFAVNIWHWKSWWQKDLEVYQGLSSVFPNTSTDFYPFDVSGGSSLELFVSSDSAKKLSLPWNAGWAAGNQISQQTRVSAVEDLNGRGFGTLTTQPPARQNVKGTGVWNNGVWSAVFVRTLQAEGRTDVSLKTGMTIPVAFAVWNGVLGDRNGQKMVTNWYRLTIQPHR